MAESNGNVTMVDAELGVQLIDDSGLNVEASTVWESIQGQHPEIASLVRWTSNTQGSGRGRQGTIWDRDRYVTPGSIFSQIQVAKDAAESDDVVSGVLESTESLAFTRMSFLCEDEDEEDIWNQIAADIDLDSRLREMWRELFVASQFYVVQWFGKKTYKVRGDTPKGNAKRRTFENLTVPLGLSLMDPMKVVPVGTMLFNQEKLAYIADRNEEDALDAAALNDPKAEPLALQIILGEYHPDRAERQYLGDLGLPINKLYLLNPDNVWRHTATRSQYQRFASVRMKSIFELLDLKQQLRQMDRAHLIGGTNFIVLIKKGTDQRPANASEVQNLQAQVRTIAQIPVIVGDHRLNVEIVTPKTDHTLNPDRYNGLDARITARLYQMFFTGGGSGGGSSNRADDSIKLAKVVGRGMESRRHMLRRTIERQIINPTVDKNASMTNIPKLRFHPSRIDLSFDASLVQFLIDVRDRGDMSRETYLNEVDIDQADEALLREREKSRYDKLFVPTNVPFAAKPGALPTGGPPNDPRTGGRNGGGTRNGGGASPGSGQGQAPAGKPKNKPKPAKAEVMDLPEDMTLPTREQVMNVYEDREETE